MAEPPENVLAAVGKAVLAVQYFEIWMNNAYHHMQLVSVDKPAGSAPAADARRFRAPTSSFLRKLAARSQIAPDIAGRIDLLLERRHLLVHRWYLHHGSPSSHSSEAWSELEILADAVSGEAQEMSFLLLSYLKLWWDGAVSGAPTDHQSELMRQMFLDLDTKARTDGRE